MTLTEARQLLADTINEADIGFTITAKPTKMPKAGGGWVTVSSVRPSPDSFVDNEAVFNIVLLVASDNNSAFAEENFDAAIDVLNVLSDLNVSGLAIEPNTVPVASSAFLALVATLTMEV